MKTPRYLFRKRFFEIQGPYTLEELQQNFNSGILKFEDELCGHTKRWVIISQRDLVKKVYPECANIFFPVIELGEFTPSQTETKRLPPIAPSPAEDTRTKSLIIFAVCIVIIILGFLTAFIFAR